LERPGRAVALQERGTADRNARRVDLQKGGPEEPWGEESKKEIAKETTSDVVPEEEGGGGPKESPR